MKLRQQELESLVKQRMGEGQEQWWTHNAHAEADKLRLLGAFSGAARRFGNAPLDDEAVAAMAAEGWFVQGAKWGEVGRLALLVAWGQRLADHELLALVEEAYRTGDLSEKQAVLRALAYLPSPQGYVAVAAEGARANALSIFEAIASHNPYPKEHFSEAAWNQLVMKAIFNEVSLRTIVGLPSRINAELVRMARGYSDERRAAGRPISEDLAMLEGFSL